jgi:hypothetical protein
MFPKHNYRAKELNSLSLKGESNVNGLYMISSSLLKNKHDDHYYYPVQLLIWIYYLLIPHKKSIRCGNYIYTVSVCVNNLTGEHFCLDFKFDYIFKYVTSFRFFFETIFLIFTNVTFHFVNIISINKHYPRRI